jgi:ribosomal protein RSM22 (predicted rRNA methylase)
METIQDVAEQGELCINVKSCHKLTRQPPALALSTFFLSTLEAQSEQMAHLNSLLSLKSPYIVLIDRRTPQGWEAIARARSYLLSMSTDKKPLHVFAPCPHDGSCPMVKFQDVCSFSQRYQLQQYTRQTKHSKRSDDDVGYCYVVIKRGERPHPQDPQRTDTRSWGLEGSVSVNEKARKTLKESGQSILREIEGIDPALIHQIKQYEAIPIAEVRAAEAGETNETPEISDINDQELLAELRDEAYGWGRLIAPALKRSGHITLDYCAPEAEIHRVTVPKSQS